MNKKEKKKQTSSTSIVESPVEFQKNCNEKTGRERFVARHNGLASEQLSQSLHLSEQGKLSGCRFSSDKILSHYATLDMTSAHSLGHGSKTVAGGSQA